MATAPAPTAPDDSVIPFDQAVPIPAAPADAPAPVQTAPAPGSEGRTVTVRPRAPPKPPPAPIVPHETAPVSVQPKVVAPAAPDQKPPPDDDVIKFEHAASRSRRPIQAWKTDTRSRAPGAAWRRGSRASAGRRGTFLTSPTMGSPGPPRTSIRRSAMKTLRLPLIAFTALPSVRRSATTLTTR